MEAHQPLDTLRHNLLLGYRLASGKRLQGRTFIFESRSVLLLILLVIAFESLLQWATSPSPNEFNIDGVTRLATIYLADGILLLGVLALTRQRAADLARFFTGYISCLPVQMIVSQAYLPILEFSGWPAWLEWSYFSVVILWALYIVARLLRQLLNLPLPRANGLALLFVVFSILFALQLPQQDIWREKKQLDPRYEAWFSLNPEKTFYAQRALLEQSTHALLPHRPGVTDLYLVTFAGYGYEDVFLNEVEYVRRLFDERFDTAGRSLLLANNLQTIEQYPLANAHNLATSLKAVATRIDPTEDVVFLFMTSHGSENFRFSVRFGSIQMNDLTAHDVRQALDDAGIEWRVIVVSSCYSGGFIEPLKTDRSLIITASAPKSTSFGCGNESNFTWFGTAYFKQGLARSSDFIEAFAEARQWVSVKEKQENIEPSDPQIYVGAEIEFRLNQLQRKQDSDAATPGD
jgi:hypothetical protein